MTHLGYARVSTGRQTLDQQIDALVAAGVDPSRIYSDKMSGARDDRPGLNTLLGYAREGDVVTVVALDRLGRSLASMIRTINHLQSRGIELRSLREGLDFTTPTGKMMAAIFGALAEYERELIRERAAAARDAARARGRQVGRPPALTPEQVECVRQMHAGGGSIPVIAETFKVSRATIYRALDLAA